MQAGAAAIEEPVAQGVLQSLGTDAPAGMSQALDRLDDERASDASLEALNRDLAGEE
ncbi:MAG: hypothetical protein QOF01_4343 [Thermomicrobiales bacterium]|jgi:hypothetical protein|nr:hypothetical protein [Thermomicrobiales bacterium]